jgi:hypothetical protein
MLPEMIVMSSCNSLSMPVQAFLEIWNFGAWLKLWSKWTKAKTLTKPFEKLCGMC